MAVGVVDGAGVGSADGAGVKTTVPILPAPTDGGIVGARFGDDVGVDVGET